jgi:hypothetical protein
MGHDEFAVVHRVAGVAGPRSPAACRSWGANGAEAIYPCFMAITSGNTFWSSLARSC